MTYKFNDGGRLDSGYKGSAGDCVCRSISITASLSYREVYERLAVGNSNQRASKNTPKGKKSARNGINTSRKWFKDYMLELGFTWTPLMKIGSGCKVHAKADELPKGRLILSLSGHWSAMIDGVINDTYDPSRNGTRCVYGYWSYKN
jgi:hypothetical protein